MNRRTNIKSKKSHPADLNNSICKEVMKHNEPNLINTDNIPELHTILCLTEKQCVYCTKDIDGNVSVDEIIPCGNIKNPGRFNDINCVNSCSKCNMSKGDFEGKELEYWIRYGPSFFKILKKNEVLNELKERGFSNLENMKKDVLISKLIDDREIDE